MKKTILALALLFVSSFSFAQGTQGHRVNGLGILKLGTNVSIMEQFGFIVKATSYSDVLQYKKFTCELIGDTNSTSQSTIYGKADPRSRVFLVRNVKLTESIEIKEVFLTFFNDTLVEIKCDYSSDLNSALDLKYGASELESKKEPHKFTKTYTGEEITLTDETFTNRWGDSKIECTSVLMKYYSGSIQPKYLSYFILSNKSSMKDIDEASSKCEARAKMRKEEEKKKELGSL